jgi:DNA-binding helix-hairpin-helix protein with protein kinase domain
MKDLNEYYNKHNNIKVYYQSELKKLKKNKRKLQLTVYLEKFHIENASIKGVGSVRKSALTSFGIETAADVEEKMVMQIPGFGKTYTKDILDWRKGLEKHFVFDPAKAIDPLEINKVKIRVIKIKQYLEKELLIAPEQLVKIRQKILQKRKHLLPLIDVSLKEVAQAKADLNYLTQHC